MRTGVASLAVAGTAILWSAVAAQLVTRLGVKPVLVIGMATLTAGLVYFTQVSVGGSYLGDLLPGFLLIGIGIGFSFVPISIAALAGVQARIRRDELEQQAPEAQSRRSTSQPEGSWGSPWFPHDLLLRARASLPGSGLPACR